MIHPIEERYRTAIADIFEEKNRLQLMLKVEVTLASVHRNLGIITEEDFHKIQKSVSEVTPELVKEIENKTHHDIMAVVQALTDISGIDKVHIGATSYDIVDTTLSLQLKQANEVIIKDLDKFKNVLLNQASNRKDLVCIGRTHGQHALPLTYGLKFALWAYEVNECLKELLNSKFFGKMNGAVGTSASFTSLGEDGFEVQSQVLDKLGLEVPLITNQVVSRIFISKYLFCLVQIVSVIDKIAKEIRNLQRTEISEIVEPFMKANQTGSSTMPHKRNPHKCENLCSIAKRLRTNILPALENISLEHERDLTNSANERIIIPETVILTHYMIIKASFIVENLEFFEEKIKHNLKLSPEIFMEKKMMHLIKEGMGRQEAYQQAKNELTSYNPEEYLGLTDKIIENVIEEIK